MMVMAFDPPHFCVAVMEPDQDEWFDGQEWEVEDLRDN